MQLKQLNLITRGCWKRIKENSECILNLLNLKIVIDAVKSNEDDDGIPWYQGHKLMNYSREVRYLLDHAAQIVERIISCFEKRYRNLFDGQKRFDVNVNSEQGDCVLFDVACLLNCNVWRSPGSEESQEDACERQLPWLMKMFNQYQELEILAPITEDGITENFLSIVRYGLKYFKMINADVLEFWPKFLKLQDENPQWRPALLIIKICLCAPISNASLERLFNQINLVKPTTNRAQSFEEQCLECSFEN